MSNGQLEHIGNIISFIKVGPEKYVTTYLDFIHKKLITAVWNEPPTPRYVIITSMLLSMDK